ncbi:MAG TPA: tRNA lysidine(34) synthetase TilS [Acidimicrobiales bacterium]|nr:tRNA lysidine(34) synthetase TilS [Acidimicrobiales bacterium]
MLSLARRCPLPPPGSRVVCAVSGGPDSLALLALAGASELAVHVVHVDHGLRPGGAGEAAIVAKACEVAGATLDVVAARVAPGPDQEARARAARYALLPHGVMVGHTADDQAETVLLNLMRGTGLAGLSGMRPTGGGLRDVCRPLLGLRRSETEAVVAELGWPCVRDESNEDLSYRRNQVRHELLPLLKSISGRDPVPLLARMARLVAEDDDLLGTLAATIDASDVRALREAPKPLAMRALRTWLRAGEGAEMHPPSLAELQRVWAVVDGSVKACQLAGGRRLSRSRGRLHLSPGAASPGV